MFESELDAIINGKVPLPHKEAVELATGVAVLALGGDPKTHMGRAYLGGTHSPVWARFILRRTQNGTLDGTGYAYLWGPVGGEVYHFAVCKHHPKDDPGANHNRGWHPAHCTLCGLNMSVDSGD